MSVNAERIELLAAALESGEFAQARKVLHRKTSAGADAFCCLGVACEIAIRNGLEGVEVAIGDDGYRTYDEHDAVLPRAVAQWYGLKVWDGQDFVDWEDPVVNEETGKPYPQGTNVAWVKEDLAGLGPDVDAEKNADISATHLNDHLDWTFPQLAAAFRKLIKN